LGRGAASGGGTWGRQASPYFTGLRTRPRRLQGQGQSIALISRLKFYCRALLIRETAFSSAGEVSFFFFQLAQSLPKHAGT